MISRRGNAKIALQSIRANRWRSFLTMLGVIIGVLSVVTTVSLGEGVKQQLRRQGAQRGSDLVTVLPGQRVERDDNGRVTKVRPTLNVTSVFSEADYKVVERVEGAGKIAPLAHVTGLAETDKEKFSGQIVATNGDLPDLLNQKLAYGSFFDEDDLNKDFAVIGQRVAEELFKENVPIGKDFTIRGETFVVRGIFEEFPDTGPLSLDPDYNNSIFVPYDIGRELMGNLSIQQIFARPAENSNAEQLARTIRTDLRKAHGGQEDFTVLTHQETLLVAGGLLNMLTAMITGIAAISLFVGGIGIMNIMFVSVTERTNEIGVRKAVGATNRQILGQFLTEATIISLLGGLFGVVLSVLLNFSLRVLTDLQPVITFPIMAIAVGAASIVGIIFGVTPAWRAAHKDPIEALRYE